MRARLTVSLGALEANFHDISAQCGAAAAAVVKANAYGLGLTEVATHLHAGGCSSYFVATCDEGIRLRQVLPDAAVQICVLEGATRDSMADLRAHVLQPILNSPAQVALWQGSGLPAGLHIDTGMQRLGIAPQAVAELPDVDFPLVVLATHFARADEQDPDSTQAQVQQFSAATAHLRRQFPAARVSISNSAAALSGGVGEDLVRAGIGMYGGNPFSGVPNPMQPVVGLHAPVLQLRQVPAGTEVGYGATFVTQGVTRLATVGVGYADGLPRLLSNNGAAIVQGQRVPIVGRVSMDLVQLDVTALGENIAEGDMVEFLGSTITVEDLAQQAQTLGYEILTGLDAARRLQRHYSADLLD